ncbi:MAG TPA: hypothetical protein PKE06_14780 [Flavilitoribacter sp.]|nr:hypothetical protein [Flavilitoribacter sp.]HMQ89860.1 hypothetical protein [Flavilitoribacter sp.]
MDFAQYTKWLRYLSIIPILVGMLTFIEIGLPYKTIETQVVSKRTSSRVKTGSTTYTVKFKGIDDQFTKEVYDELSQGDNVIVKATYFNKQIREVIKLPENNLLINDTSESIAVYGFAVAFLLSGLVWFKSGMLKNTQAKLLALLILASAIMGIRMF